MSRLWLLVAWCVLGLSAGYLVTVSSTAVVAIAIVGVLATLWVRSRTPVMPWLALVPIVLASVAIPGVKIPLFDIGASVAFALCLGFEDEEPTRLPSWLLIVLGGIVMVATASIITVNAPLSGALSRVLHLALFGLLIWAIAAGKIKKENITKAIVVGLSLSSVLGAMNLALGGGQNYTNRLTGLFGDPNVAALITVALGMIALSNMSIRRHRQLLILLMVVTVALTYSRTGLLALLLALGWTFVLHKAPASVGIVVVLVAVVVSFTLPSQIQTIGPYSSHAASDQFRAVIDQASFTDMRQHFVLGSGAGTAVVKISNGTKFFFHNSFEAIVTEFGIPGTLLYLVLAVATVVNLFANRRRSPEIEAAFLSLLVMSLTVGEVLFSFSAAVVIGSAWRFVLLDQQRSALGQPQDAALSV